MAQENQPQLPLPGGPASPLALFVNLALMPLQLLQSILQSFSTAMAAGQLPTFPTPFATSRSNDEVEEIERDERGFIIRRTVKRVVR